MRIWESLSCNSSCWHFCSSSAYSLLHSASFCFSYSQVQIRVSTRPTYLFLEFEHLVCFLLDGAMEHVWVRVIKLDTSGYPAKPCGLAQCCSTTQGPVDCFGVSYAPELGYSALSGWGLSWLKMVCILLDSHKRLRWKLVRKTICHFCDFKLACSALKFD